jgi:hypothetical protein
MRNIEIPEWINVSDAVLNALSPTMPDAWVEDRIDPHGMLASGPFVVEYENQNGETRNLIADRLHVVKTGKRTLCWLDIDRSDIVDVKGLVTTGDSESIVFTPSEEQRTVRITIRPLRAADAAWIHYWAGGPATVSELLEAYDPSGRDLR